jgi:hypothetical protein
MVRAWLSLPTSSITDPQLELLLEVEEAAQAALCTIDPWSPPLTQALYRRCGRAVAATGAPLGIVDGGEYGTATVPRWDAEIERYEAPFRKMLLG